MKNLLLLTVLICFSACTPTVELTPPLGVECSTSHGRQHPLTEALGEFSRIAGERTNQTLTITLSPDKLLGEDRLVLSKVQKNEIAMACVTAHTLVGLESGFGIFSVPFLFNDEAHFHRVLEGDVGRSLLSSLEKSGVIGICYFDPGAYYLYSNLKEISTADDLKKMKVCIPQTLYTRRFLESIQTIPAPMADDQIALALERNVIDIVVEPVPVFVEKAHEKQITYFTRTAFVNIPEILLINKVVWDSLSQEAQKIIIASAREAARAGWNALQTFETKAVQTMVENEIRVNEAADMTVFRQKADEFIAAQPEAVKKILLAIRAQ